MTTNRNKEILRLWKEGKSQREIGNIVGCTNNAVAGVVSRANLQRGSGGGNLGNRISKKTARKTREIYKPKSNIKGIAMIFGAIRSFVWRIATNRSRKNVT